MAHVNFSRFASQRRELRLDDVLPQNGGVSSFAAFCGTADQRRRVAFRGIRRSCGRMGIVVLQNDPQLAAAVGSLRDELGGSVGLNPAFRTFSMNPAGSAEHYYDPLYGLSAAAALDALVPEDMPPAEAHMLRSYLSAYLQIMQVQFRLRPGAFGAYPFNLDLLLDLTEMSPRRLETDVIGHMPDHDAAAVRTLLSQEDSQQRSYAAVRAFASEMGTYLWTRRGFARHTRASVSAAVRSGCVASVTLPTSNAAVFRCLYQELRSLIEERCPFLLVVSDVALDDAHDLRRLITTPHESADYITGVTAPDVLNVARDDAEVGALIAQHADVLVFRCASTQQAEPFSQAFGTYRRIVIDRQQNTYRQPFGIFSSHGAGSTQREVQERNVNVEELMDLGSGAVLCGSAHGQPVLFNRVVL